MGFSAASAISINKSKTKKEAPDRDYEEISRISFPN
jgi:hypothetical protein